MPGEATPNHEQLVDQDELYLVPADQHREATLLDECFNLLARHHEHLGIDSALYVDTDDGAYIVKYADDTDYYGKYVVDVVAQRVNLNGRPSTVVKRERVRGAAGDEVTGA